MDPEVHLHAFEDAGAAFAELAAGADPKTPVPPCPAWTVEDLTRHLGKVHRWAATIVETPLHQALPFDSFDAGPPGAGGKLVPWFRDGHAALVRALRQAPPDLASWSFLPAPTPLAFWCRRQAHETVMHLIDLALALGVPADQAPPPFAADGIDELLWGWLRGRPPQPGDGDGPRFRVVATDHPLNWQIGPAGGRRVSVVSGADETLPAACTVHARAIDLYLLLWNRRSLDGLRVDGDPRVVGDWAAERRV